MAWISVHEQVIGGKLRSLAKEIGCSQNEALGLLVRLWLWGINNADKHGMIIGAEKDDLAEVLSLGLDIKLSPDEVVDALVKTNWIDVDEGLYLHDWDEWQEQWYKAIDVREKNAERKRKERAKKRGQPKEESQSSAVPDTRMEADLPVPKLIIPHGEVIQDKTEDPKVEPKKKEDDYPDGFRQFWEVYPRKVGKGEAYTKYKARINCGWKPEELLEAAKNYASRVIRDNTEKQYIKHPKTFLSDNEPFTDYLPKHTERAPEENAANGDNEDNPFANWR